MHCGSIVVNFSLKWAIPRHNFTIYFIKYVNGCIQQTSGLAYFYRCYILICKSDNWWKQKI